MVTDKQIVKCSGRWQTNKLPSAPEWQTNKLSPAPGWQTNKIPPAPAVESLKCHLLVNKLKCRICMQNYIKYNKNIWYPTIENWNVYIIFLRWVWPLTFKNNMLDYGVIKTNLRHARVFWTKTYFIIW